MKIYMEDWEWDSGVHCLLGMAGLWVQSPASQKQNKTKKPYRKKGTTSRIL